MNNHLLSRIHAKLSTYLKKQIILDQEDIKYIPPGTVIDTNILSPCLGVIIHDSEGGCGAYAGHLANPENGSLELLLTRAISKLGNPANLDVYCVGNSPLGLLKDKENRYVQWTIEERKFVISTLNGYDLDKSRIFLKLTNSPECFCRLRLDVDSGKTEYILFSNRSRKPIYKGELDKICQN